MVEHVHGIRLRFRSPPGMVFPLKLEVLARDLVQMHRERKRSLCFTNFPFAG